MDFDTFIDDLWERHVDDSPTVARRLSAEGLALCREVAQVLPLARLAHHVYGDHLGQWAAGIALQQRIAALPHADGAGRAAVQRFIASLSLAGQQGDLRDRLDAADATWATALAAGTLGSHDAARAGELLHDAVARFAAAGLPDEAPCTRALAVTGNNLAAGLEEHATRSDAERELMILAAQTGRRFWALAGSWLEIERAEYRLAHSWLKAGNAGQARHHAEACLAIVGAHGDVALERFFGHEALLLAARALGDAAAADAASTAMRSGFDTLSPDDQAWCRAALDKLAA